MSDIIKTIECVANSTESLRPRPSLGKFSPGKMRCRIEKKIISKKVRMI